MANAPEIHDRSIVIDGLVISRWSRSVFEEMRQGGLTAANCTCSVWEGFRDTMTNITQWRKWFREFDDIIMPVHRAADIRLAKESNRVGIILGWQNTSAIEDRIEYIDLFKSLGVGVMQLTYNSQNLVGAGCWESQDAGLSQFGRHAVEEMNRCGVLIDLSHVGNTTSEHAIAHSEKPVAFTHCCPAAMKDHPRNKSDALMRAIADKGGFVGVATYTPFLPWGEESTVAQCVEVFEHVINLVGEESVGIGTDFTQDQDVGFFEYLRRDKGHSRPTVPGTPKVPKNPIGLERMTDYGNLTRAMEQRGWSSTRIEGVIGKNWLRILGEVWGD